MQRYEKKDYKNTRQQDYTSFFKWCNEVWFLSSLSLKKSLPPRKVLLACIRMLR